MKRLILVCLLFGGCALHSIKDKRRVSILTCTKELINYDVAAKEAYKICSEVYKSNKRKIVTREQESLDTLRN